MNFLMRLLLFTLFSVSLLGCKIEVVVDKGGEVREFWGDFGNCLEGDVCQSNIDSTSYYNEFYARPKIGWLFAGWAGGEMSLCSDTLSSICQISLIGLDRTDAQAIIDTGETAYLRPIFKPVDRLKTIIVDGREWYQPYLFKNLSWYDIAEVCPEGYCAGRLNGHDLTGWTWATVNKVNRLFEYYLGEGTLGVGPSAVEIEFGNSKAAAFFGGEGWAPTQSVHDGYVYFYTDTGGWTRNQRLRFPDQAWIVVATEGRHTGRDAVWDRFSVFPWPGALKSDSRDAIGAWFYRDI